MREYAALCVGCLLVVAMTGECSDEGTPSFASALGATGDIVSPYQMLKKVDGMTNDWTEASVWEEGGEVLEDPGFSIDIKQVFITNDRRYLYVFMGCIPSVAERFKKQALPGKFGELFFDVDNNRTTGSTDAELETFGYGNGYEARVSIDMNITIDAEGRKTPWVSYRVRRLDRAGLQRVLDEMLKKRDPAIPVLRQIARRVFLWKDVENGYQSSESGNARVAHGDDGVELYIPMSMLGIQPGAPIRIMLAEEARDFSMEGYGVRYHTLDR